MMKQDDTCVLRDLEWLVTDHDSGIILYNTGPQNYNTRAYRHATLEGTISCEAFEVLTGRILVLGECTETHAQVKSVRGTYNIPLWALSAISHGENKPGIENPKPKESGLPNKDEFLAAQNRTNELLQKILDTLTRTTTIIGKD